MYRFVMSALVSTVALAASPAFAQSDMTCMTFNSLAPAQQAQVIAELPASPEGQGNAAARAVMEQTEGATDDPAGGDLAVSETPGNPDAEGLTNQVVENCAQAPDATVGEAAVAS